MSSFHKQVTIRYTAEHKLLGVALGDLFKQLCDSMVESFRKQAVVRYGVRN